MRNARFNFQTCRYNSSGLLALSCRRNDKLTQGVRSEQPKDVSA